MWSGKCPFGELSVGEMSVRRNVRSGNFPFGEMSVRGTVRREMPVGELSFGEMSVGEMSGNHFFRFPNFERISAA